MNQGEALDTLKRGIKSCPCPFNAGAGRALAQDRGLRIDLSAVGRRELGLPEILVSGQGLRWLVLVR